MPFNYMVPGARMPPAESIRFFRLGHRWVECLLDAAFGIGRGTKSDQEVRPAGDDDESLGGFLPRSKSSRGGPACWRKLKGPTLTEVQWRDAGLRVVHVGGIASSIGRLTRPGSFISAQFAPSMIEGGEKVILLIKGL